MIYPAVIGAIAGARRRGVAAAFDPSDYGTCTAWWAPDLETGYSDGDAIATAVDQSGTGRNGTCYQTKWDSNVGGYNAYDLGVGQANNYSAYIYNNSMNASGVQVFMVVVTSDTDFMLLGDSGSVSRYYGVGQDGSSTAGYYNDLGTPTLRKDGADWSPANRNELRDGIATGVPVLLCITALNLVTWNGNKTWFCYVPAGNNFNTQGAILQFCQFDTALSTTNRDNLEAALKTKFGIA